MVSLDGALLDASDTGFAYIVSSLLVRFNKIKMLRRDFHVLDMYLCRLIKKYDIILEYLLYSSKYLDLSLLYKFF